MGLISKEELQKFTEFARKAQEEIKQFKPLVIEELESLNDFEFIKNVCKNSIDGKLPGAKEGDFLFQCASYHNRIYFDRVNRNKENALKEAGSEADVEVNVVGLIKFSMACPRAGTDLCKLRDFTYETNSYRQKVKDF
jgi:hypothetical protein